MRSSEDGGPPVTGGIGLFEESFPGLATDMQDGQKDTGERGRRTEDREVEGHSDSAAGPANVGGHQIMESLRKELKAHLMEKFTLIFEGTSTSQSRFENVYVRPSTSQEKEDYGRIPHEILGNLRVPYSEPCFEAINCLNIFSPGGNLCQQEPAKESCVRRVMTKGIAGIGKTLAVQNFSLNWAEGKSNQHIDLLFVFPFRELNMLREGEYSLLELILHFYPELKLLEDTQQLVNRRVLFIFDGLDESRFPLDFKGAMRVTEIAQRSKVGVLLTNLIKGNLLPNALFWVTTRPAAAGQIPSEYLDKITEVQGFTDQQTEEYFMKRFSSASQAKEVLSCLRGMIGFYFMGQIPIFCWIAAEVFKEGWREERSRKITTMTELYIYYLLIQTQKTANKYGTKGLKKAEKETSISGDDEMLFNLSKLAFEQLQKRNIIFYEEDLKECDVDVDQASEFCGFCSEVLKQECGLYQKKMFSFVHLSFQEFLAALYVFCSCVTKDIGALKSFLGVDLTDLGLLELERRVVDKALQSENGHLDLFLCFFLGLSLKSNQMMLGGLLPQTKSSSDTVEGLKKYLRSFQEENIPPETSLNLLLCKLELKENRFQDDIRMCLQSGISLSLIECSVLATMLDISGETVEELDLSQCSAPPEGLEKLLLQIKKCKKASLKTEHLRGERLTILASILQSSDSCLRELFLVGCSSFQSSLSDILCAAFGGPGSKLETLRLSGLALDFPQCHYLTRILDFKQSPLRVLDLTDCIYSYPHDYYLSKEAEMNKQYEVPEESELSLLTVIPAALISSVCNLEGLSMPGCHLKSKCGQVFASVLCSNSQLRELDLSRNDLQDEGVQLLSVGLGSSKCWLEILRLSWCGVTEEGCASLASALRSNPSHLRELDLSYNHPGEAGVRLLSERLQDPECRLEKLNVDQDEEHWVNPKLLNQYACDLTLDPNTVNEHLLLSACRKTANRAKEKQPYPEHPERFDEVKQVMCREALTGRCYWEVDWEGYVNIGVAYKSLQRKGWWDSEIQFSDKAWCFNAIRPIWNGYSFSHRCRMSFINVRITNIKTFLRTPRRLGLFLDWPAGILSFYSLSDDRKALLHTFHATFTEPLHQVFTVLSGSVTLSSAGTLRMDDAQSSFTPEVIPERIGVSYRFTFPGSGVFQCSLTGLVFKVTRGGEVLYKTLIWDTTLLQPAFKVPGGPLFSVRCSQDSVCQLRLPHCEPEPALVSESLSVVHITDDGLSIIQPLEITETHVVVDTPHLSAFGIVWDAVYRFVNFMMKPVSGQVLLFLRPAYRGGKLILSVLLLPSNVPLQEVKVQHENCEYIQAPSNCLLHKDKYYSLRSDPGGYKIQPLRALFFENYGPNYHASFEIILRTSTEEVTLMVEDPDGAQVWVHSLHLPALSSHASPGENRTRMRSDASAAERLRLTRPHLSDRVSDPVLNKLLDELLHCKVLSDAEVEAARAKPRADKARDVVDAVRRKGAEASSIMIAILSDNDPFLCKELGLD